MKNILFVLGSVLLAGLVALGTTFTAETLPVSPDIALAIPEAHPPPEFSIAVIHAGRMKSQAAFAFRGGAFTEPRVFGAEAVLLRHPQGNLLIDAGFGRNVDQHVRTAPFLMRASLSYDKEPPAAGQLQAAGIAPAQLKGILLTHAHIDHVSGIEDFPGVPVWVPQAELDFIRACNDQVRLICGFGELPYRVYDFPDGPYLGFDSSFDVFRDGSVVVVPAPGHTPGSVVVFATLAQGPRYAFIGDIAWQKEGVDLPAERPWLPRTALQEDTAAVRRQLAHLHRLQDAVPGLIMVPAHDRRLMQTLPPLSAAEKPA